MHIWKKMTLFIHERSVLPLAGKRRSPVITSVFGSYIDMTLFAVTKKTLNLPHYLVRPLWNSGGDIILQIIWSKTCSPLLIQ